MSSLFKELKGKDIRIKTWDEMLEMENTSLYEDEIQTVIYFLNDNGEEIISFTDIMKRLCGKIIHVDEAMIPEHLFLEAKHNLVKDREFLFIRFFKGDYEKLTIKDIGTKYLVPYYKDGWKLLGIDYDTRYIKEN